MRKGLNSPLLKVENFIFHYFATKIFPIRLDETKLS